MKGLELSKSFYEEFGRQMLEEQFPHLLDKIAVGCVGSGSENFGFDDEISRDHDFEPGFFIFLPDEEIIDRRSEFLLERAYYKLPREYMGFKRSIVNPVGGARCGVIRTAEFYRKKAGTKDGFLSVSEWFSIPEYALAEATNGEVFADNYGEFVKIRNRLLDMPEDIRRKKLAGNLLLMAQSGNYNYQRCLLHSESGAAQLAAGEFVKACMHTIFLLNCRYMPYYKWSFCALKNLPLLNTLAADLETLISTDNSPKNAEMKLSIIEKVTLAVLEELNRQELTKATCYDLEKHAYSVNDSITDSTIRNLNILCGV